MGGALTGALLATFGYVAGEAQSEGAVRGIVLMMSAFPALGWALVSFLIGLYSLVKREPHNSRRSALKYAGPIVLAARVG
jgi:Na+/melibiose symporter-like transporter